MTVVVAHPNKRNWKYHADRIAQAWNKQIPSIIETGQALIDAKEELEHGSYEAMVQSKLPFKVGTARALQRIAKHSIISNQQHAAVLPVSWATLDELTKLPHEVLLAKLKDGSIHPKMERKDAKALRPDAKNRPKPASREELIAAIQKDPNANQRDAATLDDLRERMAAILRELPKDERIREISRIMQIVDLNIHDWVSTMTIRTRN